MKTLDEFNAGRGYNCGGGPRPNDIECPKCASELWDTSPEFTLTTDPPQKHVHCPSCWFRGHRRV